MGKMPEGLRKYWAKKRRQVRRIKVKTRTVVRTARRRYGRRGGSKRTRIPIVPALAGAALGANILVGDPNGGADHTLHYLEAGNYSSAGICAKRQLTRLDTYLIPIGIVALDGVLRMLVGRVPLGKRVSLL